MPRTKRLPETGSLVTVRIVDADAVEHTFHGTFHETAELIATGYTDTAGQGRYNYVPANEQTGPGATWARIYSRTGNPIPRGGLPEQGLYWFFNTYDFYVRLDAPNVTVSKGTKAAQAWVDANLSIDNRRRLLVEQVTALDPKLGEAVDRLMGDIDEDAFDRGKDHEWRSNNW